MRWLLLLLTLPCFGQQIPVDSFVWSGKTWKVQTVIVIIDGDCIPGSSPCFGMTYCGKFKDPSRRNLIRIVHDPPDWESQRDILFHELQHVVEGCSDLKTTQHHAIYDISQPMMQLLRDPKNKKLKNWLFGN